MGSFSTDAWANFFVAEASAAAALTGLLFVALSMNLARILAVTHLPDRAFATLLLLVGALVVSSMGLIPGQAMTVLGAEYLVAGLLLWLVATFNNMRERQFRASASIAWWRRFLAMGLAQGASLSFVLAGVLLLAGAGWGLYIVALGILFSFLSGVLNAWVLLVEIMR